MTGQSLEHALSDPAIPALPATVSAAISARESDAERTRLLELCSLDPALALAILERVNSDRGMASRIGSLSRALAELKIAGLRLVALSVPLGTTRSTSTSTRSTHGRSGPRSRLGSWPSSRRRMTPTRRPSRRSCRTSAWSRSIERSATATFRCWTSPVAST
jgi:hypothetical protein